MWSVRRHLAAWIVAAAACGGAPPIPDTPAYRALARAVVHLEWCGTGFVVNDHQIATNRHVLRCVAWWVNGHAVLHFRDGGATATSTVHVAPAPYVDLALVDVEDDQRGRALTLGDPATLAVGATVYALGNHHGRSFVPHTFRVLARPEHVPDGLDGVIVLDGPSQKGESGSPIVTEDGKVVGVLFASAPDRTFAIPVAPYLIELLGR
jgi:S1-C subfamily serine protease